MGNFDEDIKRITEEVLSDGTVDRIIREKVEKGIESAINDAFKWGVLRDAIEKRVKTILVPFIESYNMDAYLVKLDTILTELVNKSSFQDNIKLLENFDFMMSEPSYEEIKISKLFEEYNKFVARNMDTLGRNTSCETGEPEYDPIETSFCFEEEESRRWSVFKYATVDFIVDEEDQKDELNRTIRLSKYEDDKKKGWEIRTDTHPDIYSLRYIDVFDLFMAKLQRAGVRVIIDEEDDADCVYSDEKPEMRFD